MHFAIEFFAKIHYAIWDGISNVTLREQNAFPSSFFFSSSSFLKRVHSLLSSLSHPLLSSLALKHDLFEMAEEKMHEHNKKTQPHTPIWQNKNLFFTQ